jgi:hypothetical protein
MVPDMSTMVPDMSTMILDTSRAVPECSKSAVYPPQGGFRGKISPHYRQEDQSMGAKRDYIPSNDKDFDIRFTHLTQYVNAKTAGQNPAWTHIP